MFKTLLQTLKNPLLFLISFGVVAFGQPAFIWWWGLLAATGGYACFWLMLLTIQNRTERFFIAMSWFACVQIVQLSWALSHPYLYIYMILILVAWLLGAQWGLISIFITPRNLKSKSFLFAIAGAWVLLEWSRLFLFSGLPFGPIGLALTGSIYSLQFASIGGLFLFSFWIILTNLFALRAWINKFNSTKWLSWVFVALLPYIFGLFHLNYHSFAENKNVGHLNALLIQTAFPVDEKITFANFDHVRTYTLSQWKKIFQLASEQISTPTDLIVLPENLVPYGTYSLIYPYKSALHLWTLSFGEKAVQFLPPLQGPYADYVKINQHADWYVNNAFFSQALANLFQAHLIIGLEDQEVVGQHEETFSSAMHFYPQHLNKNSYAINRYDKRVLVPMGEYIPLESLRQLAANYGVHGSFTPGNAAKLFDGPVPLGPSICYEEAFGHLMRDNRTKGAELLVNLTNDGWYPHSILPQQHFDHARLRAIENGVPLVRACNTGVTSAIDSLGRIIKVFGKNSFEAQENAGVLKVSVPLYHFQTLYTFWGDFFILSLSLLSIFNAMLVSFCRRNRNKCN